METQNSVGVRRGPWNKGKLVGQKAPLRAEVHSLVGAALIRSGWSTDLALLSQACLVLKV
jgi:hypothetical protein